MNDIDRYLSAVSPPQRAELERIRTLIKQHVPEAQEVITYGMPGFKVNKKYLIAYAAFKDHMSLFPGAGAIEKLNEQLRELKTSKGTVQFTLDKPLSDSLVLAIVDERLHDIRTAR